MAWRLHEHVIRGEIDNRVRGRVTGRVWLAGIAEPLILELQGDCQPDLAGCFLQFENPKPIAMKTAPPAPLQRGRAGAITASRKTRVVEVPVEEALRLQRIGATLPERLANAFYLEWDSPLSGCVVIESSAYRLEISEPRWRLTRDEISERARLAEEQSAQPFAIQIDDEGSTEVWDEFRCEQLLRESESRSEKFGELFEKYRDHPERDRIIAREMNWPWLEEALDADKGRPEENDEVSAAQNDAFSESDDFEFRPDPTREGIDWVRNEDGRVVHPIAKRAHDTLYRLLDELKSAGLFPESDDEQLENFVGQLMTLSAKLAGALSCITHDGAKADTGLSIAFLKRTLTVLNETVGAADAGALRESLSPERVVYYRTELFGLREEILALIARLRNEVK